METITPEETWEKEKNKIFKDGVLKEIEEIMQNGFKNAKSESEKWVMLLAALKIFHIKAIQYSKF